MKTAARLSIVVLLLSCLSGNGQKQFTNSGNFKVHSGGAISFFGDFVNNGSYVDSGSVTTLAGSSAQQIGGSSTTTFKNLTLNNSNGSYLSANQNISGELQISAGTFSTTGYDFTLISDANGTARIAPILGNFSGNITMQRYIGTGMSDWRFLASPVSGVTINDWQDDFVTSGFPGSTYPNFGFVSIYTYDETVSGTSDYGYNAAANATDPISPGKGYWCYVGPTPVTVDVTGPPVTFNHTFAVSYSPNAGAPEDGYVMIGNPYPSPIDWSSAAWTKTNINNAIYIWNPVLQQYASWVSGTATNGGSNLIASSQSFWIQTNGSSPVLSCTENIKTSSNTSFLKSTSPSAFISPLTLKLNIEGNNYKDETLLQFGNGGSNGYDGALDARKLFSSNLLVPGISSQDSTLKDMSINALPSVDSTIHIPVKTIVGTTGIYTITVDSSSNFTSDHCLILEDLATGTHINLTNATSYSFAIADTTKSARFLIHISAPHHTTAISAKCNTYQDGKAIVIAKGTGSWNYTWTNSSNTILKQTFASGGNDTLTQLGAGNYTVQISDTVGMCGSYLRSITIHEPSPIYAGFNFLRDSIANGSTDSLLLNNTASGATSFIWNFGDGSPSDTSFLPPAHHYALTGEYTITQIAGSGICADTLTRKITVLPANLLAVNENKTGVGVRIYPNPSNGLFYLDLGTGHYTSTSLEVYTATGQKIYEATAFSNLSEVDLKYLAKGVYFYHLLLENKSAYHGKLIIE